MKELLYRPRDNTFVIEVDGVEVASMTASSFLERTAVDQKAAAMGVRRFITFREWQAQFAVLTQFNGSVEEAMERLPRRK